MDIAKTPIQYRLYISKATGIVWDTRFPEPKLFVEIFLDEESIYTTTTKNRTIAPVWNECVELQSSDPTSKLSIKLCRRRKSGKISLIGSKELTVRDLGHLASNRDAFFDLNKNIKIGVVVKVVAMKAPAGVEQVAHTLPEPLVHPDSESPQHSSDPEEILQVVEFQEQALSMDQATRIIRQTLARTSLN